MRCVAVVFMLFSFGSVGRDHSLVVRMHALLVTFVVVVMIVLILICHHHRHCK